jgi:ABC-2 type transport system permease protein
MSMAKDPQTLPEVAPSALASDAESFNRTIGLTGLFAVIGGIIILILHAAKSPIFLDRDVAFAGIVVGMAMLLFHAHREREMLLRRLLGYGGGYGLLLLGLCLGLVPLIHSAATKPKDEIVSSLFPFGWLAIVGGLFFLTAFLKSESIEKHRGPVARVMVVIAVIAIAFGFLAPYVWRSVGIRYVAVSLLIGVLYSGAAVGGMGGIDGRGRYVARGMALVGGAIVLFTLGRLLFFSGAARFFVPAGLTLIAAGIGLLVVGLVSVADHPFFAQLRRELSAYFYSPLAYFSLAVVGFIGGFSYMLFREALLMPIPEPVVARYLSDFFSIGTVVFLVPAITMRLFAEEKRSGTYEVLMCAPVSEATIVLSKFASAWIFFMANWCVWLLYLAIMLIEQDTVFDYRPLLSYYLAVSVAAAAFISMGLFFSAITRDQIIAALFTMGGMLAHIVLYFLAVSTPEFRESLVRLGPGVAAPTRCVYPAIVCDPRLFSHREST